MSVPILHRGDRIHMIVPINAHPHTVRDKIRKSYQDQGIEVTFIADSEASGVRIISIVRARATEEQDGE